MRPPGLLPHPLLLAWLVLAGLAGLAGLVGLVGLDALLGNPGVATVDAEPPSPSTDPGFALEEGNRQFRAGRLEEALGTYRAGWDPRRPDPVLAYNLGTTAHHLGRLPEAVLWYRRAAEGSGEDRWLIENLELARRHLDVPRMAPPDLVTRLAKLQGVLWILAGLGGCGAVGLLLSRHPELERAADVLTLLTAGLLVTALLLPRLAATPAVVLEPCDGLPPGSEVWMRSAPDGGLEVRSVEGSVVCPPGSVEPVAR